VASSAGAVLRHGTRLVAVAGTDPRVTRLDELHEAPGGSPTADAVASGAVHVVPDVARAGRWPVWSARTSATGIGSCAAYRLVFDGSADVVGGLTLYADHLDAFDDDAIDLGLALALFGAATVATGLTRERAEQLKSALDSNREIGIAQGVLMATHRLTRDQALDLLKTVSQHTNRKLRDLAVDVADTGSLEVRRPRAVPARSDAGRARRR
ncbi:GAF and ANTAR domain-containing protein, partial [Angustibacter aerolatus]